MVGSFLIRIKKYGNTSKNCTIHLDNTTILDAHENDFWQKRGQAMCFGNCETVVEVVARGQSHCHNCLMCATGKAQNWQTLVPTHTTAKMCIKAGRHLFFGTITNLNCSVFSGDKGGSESIVKDVRYRRLDPMSSICTRPLETSPNIISQKHYVNVRRGSVPADFNSELRFSNGLGRNGNSGKSRIRKKILCRRSSGGPEMFTDSGPEAFGEGVTWQQWHHELLSRRTVEPALARRRGSLPIEMLATTHSGEQEYFVHAYSAMIAKLWKISSSFMFLHGLYLSSSSLCILAFFTSFISILNFIIIILMYWCIIYIWIHDLYARSIFVSCPRAQQLSQKHYNIGCLHLPVC